MRAVAMMTALGLILCCGSARAADVVLVRDGVSLAPTVAPENATPPGALSKARRYQESRGMADDMGPPSERLRKAAQTDPSARVRDRQQAWD